MSMNGWVWWMFLSFFEPLAGLRETLVTKTRTAIDFAHALKFTSDVMYPSADKIVLVVDNLNIFCFVVLYGAFCVEEAHRLASRFEWHYTSKYGSWLDMVEVEIGVMCRMVLGSPFVDVESFQGQV